jgi:hypothetical protein
VYSHTASIKFLNQDSFSDKIKDRLKIKNQTLMKKILSQSAENFSIRV